MIEATSPELKLGIVGAGAMGQGIAQVAVQGGISVCLHDARPNGGEMARNQILDRLNRLVQKGRLAEEDAEEMKPRLSVAGGLADLAGCHVVIEAVFEDLDLKHKVFAELEDVVSDECILASNTSSLLIASIGRACRRRERVAGMHFFNPVPLMKLVEIIRGPQTGDAVVSFLIELGKRMGREPVVAKDAPGFIVNHGGRAYTTEANRLLHERVATAAQIDAIMRDCCGFRMGPCELMDLTGIDVNYPVSRIIYEDFSDDPRLKTFFPHRALFEAGEFGRKAGSGHYRYDEAGNRIHGDDADLKVDVAPAARVVLLEPSEALREFAGTLPCEKVDRDDGVSPLLAGPQGEDCTALAARTAADFSRLVAVDISCDTSRRVTIMTAPGIEKAVRNSVAALISESGRAVTAINDSPGFVAQRIRTMIANLGCEMAQIGIAAPDEIDTALRLGLNYPQGPFEMAEAMGVNTTLATLNVIMAITGEERYRPSQWLRRRALLKLPIDHPG